MTAAQSLVLSERGGDICSDRHLPAVPGPLIIQTGHLTWGAAALGTRGHIWGQLEPSQRGCSRHQGGGTRAENNQWGVERWPSFGLN